MRVTKKIEVSLLYTRQAGQGRPAVAPTTGHTSSNSSKLTKEPSLPNNITLAETHCQQKYKSYAQIFCPVWWERAEDHGPTPFIELQPLARSCRMSYINGEHSVVPMSPTGGG